MKAMASRGTFVQSPTHRIRFVYTPKHTWWLNQVELWFSSLVRRLIKRGTLTSVEDLGERNFEFIEYFYQTMAELFEWTYKDRPLQV
jgi:putative transposase